MWKRLVGPYPPMQPKVGQATILAFASSASAAFALGVLFLWHCYLILTGQVRSLSSPLHHKLFDSLLVHQTSASTTGTQGYKPE